jgi:hypothetical protein
MQHLSKALWKLLAQSVAILSAFGSIFVTPASSFRLEEKAMHENHHDSKTSTKKKDKWLESRGYKTSFDNEDEVNMHPGSEKVNELLIVNDQTEMLN